MDTEGGKEFVKFNLICLKENIVKEKEKKK